MKPEERDCMPLRHQAKHSGLTSGHLFVPLDRHQKASLVILLSQEASPALFSEEKSFGIVFQVDP